MYVIRRLDGEGFVHLDRNNVSPQGITWGDYETADTFEDLAHAENVSRTIYEWTGANAYVTLA